MPNTPSKFDELYAPPYYIDPSSGELLNNDEQIIEWHCTNENKARAFLRANRAWKNADICMSIFYGDETQKIPTGLSKVTIKKQRRQAKEAIENACNIRPRWKHRSSKVEYEKQALLYDDLRDDWWYSQNIISKLKETLQYAGGGCQGYLWLWPDYDPATGQLEITATSLSWKQVLPFHAGINSSIDSLYGVSIHLELPVPEAHMRFPKHIGIIKADRNSPSTFTRSWKRVQRVWKGAVDRLRNRSTSNLIEDLVPVADIYFTWVRDNQVNTSGHPLYIGEPGAHYSYVVPSIYDKQGNRNRITMQGKVVSISDPEYASAQPLEEKQCKIFPYKRLIISTNNGIIYDGPPLYFNRYNPIVPFTFEKVAGEFLGFNLINDGRRLEESANRMLQALEDAVVGKQQPPMAIDTKVPESIRAKLRKNPKLLTGKLFEYDTRILGKNALTALIDSKYYDLDPRAIELIKFNQDMSDYLMGTNDNSFLAKLNQMPSADTQESFLRSLGALAMGYSISIEQSILQVAKIWLDFAPQVYTTERIFTKYGVNLEAIAMDFDPLSLIPKKEDIPDSQYENLYPGCSYAERLQKHSRNFSIYAAPNSLQERMSQTNKLLLAQLQKMGVPISGKRLYATFIDDGQFETTEEEFYAEKIKAAQFAATLQKILEMANQAADPQNALAQSLIQSLKQNQEGRPNTFQKPPTLQAKTDNSGVPRGTIASS